MVEQLIAKLRKRLALQQLKAIAIGKQEVREPSMASEAGFIGWLGFARSCRESSTARH